MSNRVVEKKEMKVPPGALRQAVLDFKSYPEFLPEVVHAEIVEGSNPKAVRVAFEIEVIKRFRYELVFDTSQEDSVTWKLHSSDLFKKNEGGWKFQNLKNGRTEATYELEVGFGFIVPSWVSKKLVAVNLPKLLESFENKAKEFI